MPTDYRRSVWLSAMLLISTSAAAQWNPAGGQWGKTEPTDLRVMTWNVQDGLCSSQPKLDGLNNWGACARIIALLKPDILIIQEAGDNDGNGTGAGVDSPATLDMVVELLFLGGTDPFRGGAVTGYVQQFAPGFNLPHIFSSALSDGYNRNIILSRYPFADLNGDGASKLSDIHSISSRANSYALGGNGGIRGFAFAEIDLPDHVYEGDLVIGNAHLKSGGTQSDRDQRLRASTNVAYYIDFLFNGAGTGLPDPSRAILDNPPVQQVLPPGTTVVWGGDWNEDELTNGRKGPAEWLTQAAVLGGTDGTDVDGSDATYDSATDPLTGSRATLSSSKLDYLAWFDSVATARRAFILNTSAMNAPYPVEFEGITSPRSLSAAAADHRPVIVDLVLSLAPPCACTQATGDTNNDCMVNGADLANLLAQFGEVGGVGMSADLNTDGQVDGTDLSILLGGFGCGQQ